MNVAQNLERGEGCGRGRIGPQHLSQDKML